MLMLILIALFLLSKTQNYMCLSSLYQQKRTRNCQNILAKDLKDQCISISIKQKVKIKIWQMNKYIFSNQNFLVLTDCFVLIYSSQDDNDNAKKFYPKGVIRSLRRHQQWKKVLWTTNRFWHKTIWRNKKVNNRWRWRLYHRIYVRLRLYQKPFKLIALDLNR